MRYLPTLLCPFGILFLLAGCAEETPRAPSRTPTDATIANSSPADSASSQGVGAVRQQKEQATSDWPRFRGPNGSGVSSAKGLPVQWSETKNVIWRTNLPGPGTSSPVTMGDRIFVTCYTGYGLVPNEGDMNNLRRHVVCVSRRTGKIIWQKQFVPELPESHYKSPNGSQHGYSSSTPVTDGERLYVFFGKSGVYCLDRDGKQLWHTRVGDGLSGYGSANSPLLYKNLVIINACIESDSVVALDKMTGKEIWRANNVRSAYNTPVLVEAPGGRKELVLNESSKVVAFDPDNGKELWRVGGFRFYVIPSVVAHNGIVYVVRSHTLAIRAGGRGDVTNTHVLWKVRGGASVPSPVYHQGHLYWVEGSIALCVDATTGKRVYTERLSPQPRTIYSSVLVADGKLYTVSQNDGAFVLPAEPKFKQLAHNVFPNDRSRTNASLIAIGRRILLRNDRCLYCLGLPAEE